MVASCAALAVLDCNRVSKTQICFWYRVSVSVWKGERERKRKKADRHSKAGFSGWKRPTKWSVQLKPTLFFLFLFWWYQSFESNPFVFLQRLLLATFWIIKTGHQRLQTLGRLNGVETILEASSGSDVVESVKVSRWPMLSPIISIQVSRLAFLSSS